MNNLKIKLLLESSRFFNWITLSFFSNFIDNYYRAIELKSIETFGILDLIWLDKLIDTKLLAITATRNDCL